MGRGEIDKFPVNQLEPRYELARSAVYTRMKQLGIKPHRVGNKAYITGNELQWMDALHAFINETGGSAAEFIEANGLNPNANGRNSKGRMVVNDNSPGSDLLPTGDFGKLIRAFTEALSRAQQPPPDPVKPYRDLEDAARNRWELSTSVVARCLGVTPAEIVRCGNYFQDAGFIFTKVGYRQDGQEAWRVSKPGQR